MPDAADAKITCTEDSLTFNATSGGDTYSCELKLKGKVKPDDEETKWNITGRNVQCHIVKEESERWEGLLADKKLGKNLVKPDFDMWVDSEDEAEGAGFDMNGMGGGQGMGGMPGGMGGMPGMGGMGGMPGMGGMGGMPGMGGMGGMPGMGGMGGMPGMGGGGGEGGGMDMAKLQEMMAQMKESGAMPGGEEGGDEDGDDEDDEDLPDLEDADEK